MIVTTVIIRINYSYQSYKFYVDRAFKHTCFKQPRPFSLLNKPYYYYFLDSHILIMFLLVTHYV
ncbi:uncharacterized protein METZ01_LOCUS71546 [marine metagenome]|jgi:hypothetical protein|uniref:Uncharacterized protein n=1 Tax=marine metagenome TaxID=408172 RepID=A0A381TRM3_9ZZZZ